MLTDDQPLVEQVQHQGRSQMAGDICLSWCDVPTIRVSDLSRLSCRPICMYHSLTSDVNAAGPHTASAESPVVVLSARMARRAVCSQHGGTARRRSQLWCRPLDCSRRQTKFVQILILEGRRGCRTWRMWPAAKIRPEARRHDSAVPSFRTRSAGVGAVCRGSPRRRPRTGRGRRERWKYKISDTLLLIHHEWKASKIEAIVWVWDRDRTQMPADLRRAALIKQLFKMLSFDEIIRP